MMVERNTANGVEEACQLTGISCPKSMRNWLRKLGIKWEPRHLVIDKTLYQEQVRKYNAGRLHGKKK